MCTRLIVFPNWHLEELIHKNQSQELELARLQTEQRVVLQMELERLRRQHVVEIERNKNSQQRSEATRPQPTLLAKALQSKIDVVEEKLETIEKTSQLNALENLQKQKCLSECESIQILVGALEEKVSKIIPNSSKIRFPVQNVPSEELLPNIQIIKNQLKFIDSRLSEVSADSMNLNQIIPSDASSAPSVVGKPDAKHVTSKIDKEHKKNESGAVSSLKQYAASLQKKIYKLTTMVKLKNDKIEELMKNDWAQALAKHSKEVESLQRQIKLQSDEFESLYRMYKELQVRVESECVCPPKQQVQLDEFVQNYAKKLRNYKSKIQELQRRHGERDRRWSVLSEECAKYEKEIKRLKTSSQQQQQHYQSIIKQKDHAIVQANQSLATLSGLDTDERRAAAEYLIETLQRHIQINNQLSSHNCSMESSVQILKEDNTNLRQQQFQDSNDRIKELEDELGECKQHNGVERISQLEDLINELQNKNATAEGQLQQQKEAMERLVESWTVVDEGDMFDFLSKLVKSKDEIIRTLQAKTKELGLNATVLSQRKLNLEKQISKREKEIETIKVRHLQMSKIFQESRLQDGSQNFNSMDEQDFEENRIEPIACIQDLEAFKI